MAYDILWPEYIHRFDVRIGDKQWGVDMRSLKKVLSSSEIKPIMTLLANGIEHDIGTKFELLVSEALWA